MLLCTYAFLRARRGYQPSTTHDRERGLMSEITQERRAPGGGDPQSAREQAKEKVQEASGEARQQVSDKAQEVRTQAGEGIRQQLDGRSTQAGEQISSTADALRRVGGQLREEGKSTPAQYAEKAAEPVERLGRYLTEADGERLLRDAEQFARRRPWVAVVGGATLGFLVARFIKASSTGDGAASPTDPYARAALPPAPVGQRGEFHGQSGQ
jgi:ElaB/YqjD/DUF883 family membrane-anchored ribosome-binding protein